MILLLKNLLSFLYINFVFIGKWRKKNHHNETHAINRFNLNNVHVGNSTYGPIEILYDTGAVELIIGNYCSIAKGVKFFLGGGHNYRRVSTFPFQTKVYGGIDAKKRDTNLDIIVEDDVWIGYDAIVLPGARIGKGSVIGARSIVTGVIPPYSIYVGNKVIKKRFPDEIIKEIEDIDFASIRHIKGDAYEQWCTKEVTPENIDDIIRAFK